MSTKAERTQAAERAHMTEIADRYDPPRPWTIQPAGWSRAYPWATYVTDANGYVIPYLTCVYPTAMLRRIVDVVNREAAAPDPERGPAHVGG